METQVLKKTCSKYMQSCPKCGGGPVCCDFLDLEYDRMVYKCKNCSVLLV